MALKHVHCRIEGKVQGVWFRAWTEKTAISHGLNGWVRNCRDGSVEALFSGPDNAVDAMLADCLDGPPLAKVTGIDQTPAEAPDGAGFRVLDDA